MRLDPARGELVGRRGRSTTVFLQVFFVNVFQLDVYKLGLHSVNVGSMIRITTLPDQEDEDGMVLI